MSYIMPRLDFAGSMFVGAVVFVATVLANAVFKPFVEKYFSRLGENLANKQDLKNVLEQVEKVTHTTEKIKAEISGGLWHKQWILTQKRDAYVRLIDAMETIRVTRGSLRRSTQSSLAEGRHHLQKAIAEFRRARALARLLVLPDAVAALRHLLKNIETIDSHRCTDIEFEKSQEAIRAALDSVVDIAKRDLIIGEVGEDPTISTDAKPE